jgi:hypothetical protein
LPQLLHVELPSKTSVKSESCMSILSWDIGVSGPWYICASRPWLHIKWRAFRCCNALRDWWPGQDERAFRTKGTVCFFWFSYRSSSSGAKSRWWMKSSRGGSRTTRFVLLMVMARTRVFNLRNPSASPRRHGRSMSASKLSCSE